MTTYRIISPVADIHGTPDLNALRGKNETQAVFGEAFTVENEENGWCKGASAHDGYKGFIEKKHISPAAAPPTHIVTAARSHVYRDGSIKTPRLETFSFGSHVCVAKIGEKFAELSTGGWIYQSHLAAIDSVEEDYIKTAQTFLETPYYWGGRSGFGIDCSGLVQVVLARAGLAVPRDTEDQETTIGKTVDTARSGDLVFFKGHVGIMIDADTLLHANAHHMKTVIEPLWMVDERSGGVTSIRRI